MRMQAFVNVCFCVFLVVPGLLSACVKFRHAGSVRLTTYNRWRLDILRIAHGGMIESTAQTRFWSYSCAHTSSLLLACTWLTC